MKILILIINIILTLWILYAFYQLVRNKAIYKIQIKWIESNQSERLNRHDYFIMFKPCKKNWYGFKYPKEKDYL